jgi:hypothetical protein
MQTAVAREEPRLARRLDPPHRWRPRTPERQDAPSQDEPQPPRPATRPRPTKGPGGEVRWWERPAPGGDEAMWAAVRQIQAHRIERRVSVSELARRLAEIGHPISRETLSRVLNGKQPTSWDTIRALAEVLGTQLR